MKKIIKLYDECVQLHLRAAYQRNNTCLTHNGQEEAYERLLFEAQEKESALFAEIRKLKSDLAKAKKLGRALIAQTELPPSDGSY